jgi:hypothetical protein
VSRPLLGPNVEWAGCFAVNKIGKRCRLPRRTGLKRVKGIENTFGLLQRNLTDLKPKF